MEDIKYLCDRAVIIRNGSKIFDGSLNSILEKYQTYRTVSVVFEKTANKEMQLDVDWIEKSDFKWVFKTKKEEVKFIIKAIMDSFDIDDISIEDESLGDIVEKIYCEKETAADEEIH